MARKASGCSDAPGAMWGALLARRRGAFKQNQDGRARGYDACGFTVTAAAPDAGRTGVLAGSPITTFSR